MEDNILDNLVVSVTGLGYVGLPIALAFSKKTKVIGFDIDESRIELLKKEIDPTGEISLANSRAVILNSHLMLRVWPRLTSTLWLCQLRLIHLSN